MTRHAPRPCPVRPAATYSPLQCRHSCSYRQSREQPFTLNPPPPSSRRSPYKSAQKKSPPSNNISIQSESSEKKKDEIREHDDRWLNPIKKISKFLGEPPAFFLSLICPRLTFCVRGGRLDLWHGRFRRREFIHRHRQPALPWTPSVGGSPFAPKLCTQHPWFLTPLAVGRPCIKVSGGGLSSSTGLRRGEHPLSLVK